MYIVGNNVHLLPHQNTWMWMVSMCMAIRSAEQLDYLWRTIIFRIHKHPWADKWLRSSFLDFMCCCVCKPDLPPLPLLNPFLFFPTNQFILIFSVCVHLANCVSLLPLEMDKWVHIRHITIHQHKTVYRLATGSLRTFKHTCLHEVNLCGKRGVSVFVFLGGGFCSTCLRRQWAVFLPSDFWAFAMLPRLAWCTTRSRPAHL